MGRAARSGRAAVRWVRALAPAYTWSSSRMFARRTKTQLVRDEGPPHAQSERTPGQKIAARRERNSLNRPTEEHAQSDTPPSQTQATPSQNRTPTARRGRERTALVRPLYTPRMQISGSKGPVGGATLAHWSGEKEACISLDPDTCTRGSAIFP